MTTTAHAAQPEKPLTTLVRELLYEIRALLRDEVRLAKAETLEKGKELTRNLVVTMVGAAFAFAAIVVLASAADRGLTALLAQFVDLEIAVWLAPLLLGLAIALVSWMLIQKGLGALRNMTVVPERTVQTLKEDRRWIESRVTS
jgi:hypothetical protein